MACRDQIHMAASSTSKRAAAAACRLPLACPEILAARLRDLVMPLEGSTRPCMPRFGLGAAASIEIKGSNGGGAARGCRENGFGLLLQKGNEVDALSFAPRLVVASSCTPFSLRAFQLPRIERPHATNCDSMGNEWSHSNEGGGRRQNALGCRCSGGCGKMRLRGLLVGTCPRSGLPGVDDSNIFILAKICHPSPVPKATTTLHAPRPISRR